MVYPFDFFTTKVKVRGDLWMGYSPENPGCRFRKERCKMLRI